MERDPEIVSDNEETLSDDEKYTEILATAEAIANGFRLAEFITPDRDPMIITHMTVPAELMNQAREILPEELHPENEDSDIGCEIKFKSESLIQRPSFEMVLFAIDEHDSHVYATLSSDTSSASPLYSGTVNKYGIEHTYQLDRSIVGELLESVIKNRKPIVNDSGIITQNLIGELLADPQYPATSRFIMDSLIEMMVDHSRTMIQKVEINGQTFLVEVISENKEITEVAISKRTMFEPRIENDVLIPGERYSGAQIQLSRFKHAIRFFKDTDNRRRRYSGDEGDLKRLREQIDALHEYFTEVQP